MINKISFKKRFFLYCIAMSFIGSFFTYIYIIFTAPSNIYCIEFKSSVQGLKPGSFVNYKGVKIGVVEKVNVDLEKDSVNVFVKIDCNFSIYSDFYAICNSQGFSGLSCIDFSRDYSKEHIVLKSGDLIEGKISDFERYQIFLNILCDNLEKLDYNKINSIINYLSDSVVLYKNNNNENFLKNIIEDERKIRTELIPKISDTVTKTNEVLDDFNQGGIMRWLFGKKKKK